MDYSKAPRGSEDWFRAQAKLVLVVQCLRLCDCTEGDIGSASEAGTHAEILKVPGIAPE